MLTRKIYLNLGVCGLAIMSHAAMAQEATTAPEEGTGYSSTDIVVTANKREQKLNDVGLSVAVLGADTLQQRQISSLQDIASTVPGLSYTQGITGSPVYTLRGVGFYETSIGAFPSVSVYIDEQPLAFPALTQYAAFDLERIEVLKGPQGTLFGQNATGGAINYIAAKPTDDFQAGGSLSYGRFHQVTAEAFVSGPLGANLGARLAGRVEHADGWQYSTSRPGDRNGKAKNYAGRLTIAFNPGDSARFLLNLNGFKDKGETIAAQYIALQPQQAREYLPAEVENAAFTPRTPRASDWSTSSVWYPGRRVPFNDNEMYQIALRSEVDLGDFATLTSLTNYVHMNIRRGTDFDGFALNVFEIPYNNGKIRSFTQELRLSNQGGGSFNWVIGGNYEQDKVREEAGNQYTYTSANRYFGTVFGAPFQSTLASSSQRITNYAVFGNAEYDLSDAFAVKAGIRYTKSKNRYNFCQIDVEPPYYSGNLLNFFANVLSGDPDLAGAYVPGQCITLNASEPPYQPTEPRPLFAPGDVNNKLVEDNVSWRLGVDYKPRPGMLLYANVSKGYKAGSFPTINGTTTAQYLPVKQESVLSYEAGFKATLLDRTLQLNGAGFYYDYKDKQLRTKLLDDVFGQLDIIQNIPKSHVWGFEVEAQIRPTRYFTVNAAYTYLDAVVDRYTGVDAGGQRGVVFDGSPIPFTPKHQISISADYEQPVGSNLVGFVGASASHRSDSISVVGGLHTPAAVVKVANGVTRPYGIEGYTLVDGQLGIRAEDDSWKAFVWGKNIFNTYYWSNVVSGYDTVSRFAGRPATYGVTVAFKLR
jgi:outer membrane receptor protein involved in Fe transport